MKKVNFIRKAHKEDIFPRHQFVVEKTINLNINEFRIFEDRLLADYDFIKENEELMYVDSKGVWHSILVTAEEVDYGILVESSGYSYARYSAYVSKRNL